MTMTPQSTDTDAQAAIEPTFDELPMQEDVRRAIDEMGWANPTPVQLAAYGPSVDGRDLIVQARTGTGKTGAFGIPLVDRLVSAEGGVQALVLAPTRELALQSSRELQRIGTHRSIQTAAVYGGAPFGPQVTQLESGTQIVSGTPGRVLDHLRRGTLDPSGLRVLVLDEADEMLSMGFAKELNAIMEMLPESRQTLLFSATVDYQVQRMADGKMKDPEFVSLSSDQVGATTVSHFVYFVSGKGRTQDLVRVLEIEDPESAVIFCNTKAETEQVAAELSQGGFNADWLNGDLPQNEREQVMRRTREGDLRYMVATDVAARGIDISHLTHVINYGFPPHIEQYIHRTGRTGRAGRTGTAVSLVSPQELGSLYYLRLQYKIFPVERSLPTAGEKQTRLEADRLMMMEQAFAGQPDELDRSVARRLLTHPDAERLLGGLLQAFFGTKGDAVDEEAAAARRARGPEPVSEPDPRRKRRSRTRRSEPREAAPRDPSPAASDAPAPRQEEPVAAPPAEAASPEPAATPPAEVASAEPIEPQGEGEEGDDNGASEGHHVSDEDMTRLYVNVGRRDGVKAGDVGRLLREQAELRRTEIGRIRVRDKHTFVEVLRDRVDHVVESVSGQTLGDREVVVEPARASK